MGPYSASYSAVAASLSAQYFLSAASASRSLGWVSRYSAVSMAEKDAICILRMAFCLLFGSALFTDLTSFLSAISLAFIAVERFIQLVEYSSSAKAAFAIVDSSPALRDGIYHRQRLDAVGDGYRTVVCLLRLVAAMTATVDCISVVHNVPFFGSSSRGVAAFFNLPLLYTMPIEPKL